jgi:hypothetical protein
MLDQGWSMKFPSANGEEINIDRRAYFNVDRQQRFRRGSHIVFQRHAFVFEGSQAN